MSGCLRVLPAQGSRGSRSAQLPSLPASTAAPGPQTPRHLGPSLAGNPGTSPALATSAAPASYYTTLRTVPTKTRLHSRLSGTDACPEIALRSTVATRPGMRAITVVSQSSAPPSPAVLARSPLQCAEIDRVSDGSSSDPSRWLWSVSCGHSLSTRPCSNQADTLLVVETRPARFFCGKQASSRAPRRRHNMQQIAPSCRSSGSGFPIELASTSQSCSVLPGQLKPNSHQDPSVVDCSRQLEPWSMSNAPHP